MKIIPINDHVVIKPIEEKTAYVSSQSTYEERGEVIEIPAPCISHSCTSTTMYEKPLIDVGTFVYFDSWCAAKYKDGEGNEFWVVPVNKIRAIET